MRTTHTPAIATTIALASLVCGQAFPVPAGVVSEAFSGRKGALVLIDCASGAASDFRPDASAEKRPPARRSRSGTR